MITDKNYLKLFLQEKIQASLELLRNKNDIILMGDRKLITKGLKTDFAGDVNLFGHESGPNLEDLKQEYSNLLNYISACCRSLKCSCSQDQFNILGNLLDITMKLCQRIRNYHTAQKKKLSSFMNRHDNQPEKAISSCKTNMYTSAIWIKKALKCNMQLMQITSTLMSNLHLFWEDSQLDVSELHNVRILYSTDYVCQNINILEYPHLIKCHSDIWYDLMQASVLTTDTAYAAMGLDSVLAMKNHFQ